MCHQPVVEVVTPEKEKKKKKKKKRTKTGNFMHRGVAGSRLLRFVTHTV